MLLSSLQLRSFNNIISSALLFVIQKERWFTKWLFSSFSYFKDLCSTLKWLYPKVVMKVRVWSQLMSFTKQCCGVSVLYLPYRPVTLFTKRPQNVHPRVSSKGPAVWGVGGQSLSLLYPERLHHPETITGFHLILQCHICSFEDVKSSTEHHLEAECC